MRNCFSIFFLLLTFFFSERSTAQKFSGTIKGKIISEDGKPAANVNVELKKTKRASLTNMNGKFILQHLPETTDTLVISFVNLKPTYVVVNLDLNETINIGTIKIDQNIQQLQTVEVNGRTVSSYKSDYSFFGNKTETPVIDIPQSISVITKELIDDKMEFTLKDAVMK